MTDFLHSQVGRTGVQWLQRGVGAYVLYKTFEHFSTSHKSLRDKVVLITGSANGIGRLMAFECAKRGSQLVLWDIQKEALAKCVAEVKAKYPSTVVHSATCDLSQRDDIYAAAKRTKAEVSE